MARPRLLFVTGKLAESALRRTLADLAPKASFDYQVAVLPITVAALAPTSWIARHLETPANVDRIVLPGLCPGELHVVAERAGVPVERGPKDLRDLPELFGARSGPPADYGAYDIEIVAEINHAPQLSMEQLLAQASAYRASGADVIDVGCDPGGPWPGTGAAVRSLREQGFRVSIDSFDPAEVDAAVRAGAELVLSVNGSNRAAVTALHEKHSGWQVVALPDDAHSLDGLDRTIEALQAKGIPFRIDPVLEPIGFGFGASLGRYLEVRRRYPDAELFMGIGNLTELTDVDSAGINVLLLGFCQELGIRGVLTTEVINWARSAVRELDRARRLVHYAVRQRELPKRLDPSLVMLRDPKLRLHGEQTLRELAEQIADRNFRLFAEGGLLHAMNGKGYHQETDPFRLFARLQQQEAIDPAHAFYLGYELAKAVTALTLAKNYVQDQALSWGLLTVPEKNDHPPQ